MKKTLILILTIIVFGSCASGQITSSPVNDYMDSLVKSIGTKIIVLDKKIANKKTLAILKGDLLFNAKTNSYEREGKASNLYNKDDWEVMSKEYSYDTIPKYWTKSDFKLSNIIVTKNDNFIKGDLYKEYRNVDYPVYSFSNPIFYKKREYMIFTILNSSTTFGAEPIEFVIVMKKKNNKWITVEKVYKN